MREAMLQLLQEAVSYEAAQFDGPADHALNVSGSDLVEWFSGWRKEVKGIIEQAEKSAAPSNEALRAFVDTVNATGGVVFGSDGRVETVGDPEWMDLADAYILACEALGVKPNEKKEGA